MKRLIRSSEDLTFKMDKQAIIHNLKLLDAKLHKNNMYGEVDLYGGAVMCLGLNARQSTHDIDAVFQPKANIYDLIAQVAKENGLPDDWMNDSVKGFASPNGEFWRIGEDEFTNLTVMMTTPEYLFAMKCLSCRLSDESATELQDIKFLINYLELKSVDEAIDVILKYYPKERFKIKTQLMLEELFDNNN